MWEQAALILGYTMLSLLVICGFLLVFGVLLVAGALLRRRYRRKQLAKKRGVSRHAP